MAYQQNVNLIGLPAQSLANLSQNPLQGLMQGYQFGNALYEQDQQRGLQQDLRNAIDPQTGEMNWGKAIASVMQRDPATGMKLYQQKRLEDQQNMVFGALGLGGASGQPTAPGQTGGSFQLTPAEKLMVAGSMLGEPGKGITALGTARTQADLEREKWNRGYEPGYIGGAPVQIPRTQLNPSAPAPAPAPAPSGQPAPAPVGGEESHNGVTRSQWNTWSREQKAQFIGGLKAGERSDFVNWAYQTPQSPGGINVADFPLGEVMRLLPEQRQRIFQTLRPEDQQRLLTALQQPGNDALTIGQVLRPRPSQQPAPQQPIQPPVVSGPSGIPPGPPSPVPDAPLGAGSALPPGVIQTGPSTAEKLQQEKDLIAARNQAELSRQRQLAAETEQRKIAEEQRQAEQQQRQAYPVEKSKKEAETDLAMRKDWRTQAGEATKGLMFVSELEALIKAGTFDQGALANWYGKVGKILYAVGAPIDSKAVQQDIKNAHAASLLNQTVLALIGGNLGAQISNEDRQFYLEMLPQIGTNPEAARAIANRLRASFSIARDKWTGWLQASRTNPNLRESEYEDQWQQDLTNRLGGGSPSAAPGATAPAPAPAPTPQSSSYSLRFPDGNTLSRQQFEHLPEAAQRLIVDRVKRGQIQKIGAP